MVVFVQFLGLSGDLDLVLRPAVLKKPDVIFPQIFWSPLTLKSIKFPKCDLVLKIFTQKSQ